MSKSEKIVVTINNEEVPISKCKKYETGWYKIGNTKEENSGDCYEINGKFYRIETGMIVFNFESKEYVLKNDTLTHGIVNFDENGYILGYFPIGPKSIPTITPNGEYYCFDEELFKNTRLYRERLSNGKYYHIDLLGARDFNHMILPPNDYKTSLPYDSGGVLDHYMKIYNSNDIKLSENVKNYAKVLGSLSFGLEFETIAGLLPERILNRTGLIPLRDGSISGIEYVTVPMTGEKGLQTLINSTKELKKRTKYNDTCALHIHYGNVPRTKEFILAFFKLTCALQEEIYQLFPLYKKYNFRVKNKNYSKPYPIYELISQMDPVITSENINCNFNILYKYLSMGEDFGDLNNDLKNVKNHPADREGRAKWNINTRYYLNNLIPLIFGNKKTIEFRIHTPTFDANKIVPFLIWNACMINFTIMFQDKILKDKNFLLRYDIETLIKEVILNMNCKNSNCLIDSILGYIHNRRTMTEKQNQQGLIRGNEEEIRIGKYINWNIEPISDEDKSIKDIDPILEQLKKSITEKYYQSFLSQKVKIERAYSLGDISIDVARNEISKYKKQWDEARDQEILRKTSEELNKQEMSW